MRRVKVAITNLDGVVQGTLILEVEGGRGSVIYRPYRKHDEYRLTLHETAQLVMDRAAKQDAAAKGIPIPMPRKRR